MDETLRFFIGVAIFLALITFELLKERPRSKHLK
jgi:hypothetical protein